MRKVNRPIVLSIAGYDPTGGAGLLADIKTFEQHKVYGLGIVTALTFQTENDFFAVNWIEEKELISQLREYLKHYHIKVIKFGIIQNWKTLNTIITLVRSQNDKIKIIIDPILKSTSGFNFFSEADKKQLFSMLGKIDLLTPNYDESMMLSNNVDGKAGAKHLSQYCDIYLKGGHNPKEPGTDYLFTRNSVHLLKPSSSHAESKHGSGCVLSAAIAANLALGNGLLAACKKAKRYTEKFLNSNATLLGYHVQ